MHIEWLQIQNVRNLTNFRIQPTPQLNLFIGPNACGKTTILEAIYLLSRARSFRTPRVNEVIQHGKESLLVSAGLRYSRAGLINTGIEKGHGKTIIHYNGENIKKISEQAKNIPLVLVAPDTHNLIMGTPKQRRHWLDWAMFHVEPAYLEDWRNYHKALRQRNNLLKSTLESVDSMSGWEQVMVDTAERINIQRNLFLKRIEETLVLIGGNLFPFIPRISLLRGWRDEQPLSVWLQQNRGIDSQIGYTRHGIHCADIQFLANEYPLSSVCSRGQVKLFIIILLISQAKVTEEITGERSLYLFDDYTSEIDALTRRTIIDLLIKQETQAFFTSTEPGLKDSKPNITKTFHVERGELVKVVE